MTFLGLVALVFAAATWPMWGWLFAFVFFFAWRIAGRRANYYANQADMRGYAIEAVGSELQRAQVTNLVVERAKRELTDGR